MSWARGAPLRDTTAGPEISLGQSREDNAVSYKAFVISLALLLSACRAPAASTPPVAPSTAATSTLPARSTPPPAPPAADYPTDPVLVVSAFLASVRSDPSGQSGLRYLSRDLAARVSGGQPIGMLLGVQNIYQDVQVVVGQQSQGEISRVQATLRYSSADEERLFSLIQQDGRWRIVDVTSVPVTQSVTQPGPGAVVEALLRDIQQGQSAAQVAHYASSLRRAQMPQGGLIGLLNAGGALDSFAITDVRVAPDNAAVSVDLDVGGTHKPRVVTLAREQGTQPGWYIDYIDTPQR